MAKKIVFTPIAITLLIFIILFIIILILCSIWLSSGIHIEKYEEKIKDIDLESDNNENNIKVYTLGTNMNRELYNNISSFKQYGYNYKVIGIGEKFEGWRWRVLKYIDCIKEHRIKYGENTIIIFIDGYDALACSSEEGLYDKFKNYNCRILGGIEKGFTGALMDGYIDNWWKYYNLDKNKYKYTKCNAGFIMGYPKELEELYQWIYDNNYNDDQVGLREYTNTFPEKIYYDINSIIIYNRRITDQEDKDINLPHFKHYYSYSGFGKLLGVTFNDDVKKYIKDSYSLEPIESKNTINNLKFTIGFSTVAIIILTLLFIPQIT